MISIGENMAEKIETPREVKKSQQVIKEDLKLNKAKRGKEAVENLGMSGKKRKQREVINRIVQSKVHSW